MTNLYKNTLLWLWWDRPSVAHSPPLAGWPSEAAGALCPALSQVFYDADKPVVHWIRMRELALVWRELKGKLGAHSFTKNLVSQYTKYQTGLTHSFIPLIIIVRSHTNIKQPIPPWTNPTKTRRGFWHGEAACCTVNNTVHSARGNQG